MFQSLEDTNIVIQCVSRHTEKQALLAKTSWLGVVSFYLCFKMSPTVSHIQ
jgi:hypothetical protein